MKLELDDYKTWTAEQLEGVKGGSFPFFLHELDPYTQAWVEHCDRLNACLESAYADEKKLKAEIADLKIIVAKLKQQKDNFEEIIGLSREKK